MSPWCSPGPAETVPAVWLHVQRNVGDLYHHLKKKSSSLNISHTRPDLTGAERENRRDFKKRRNVKGLRAQSDCL